MSRYATPALALAALACAAHAQTTETDTPPAPAAAATDTLEITAPFARATLPKQPMAGGYVTIRRPWPRTTSPARLLRHRRSGTRHAGGAGRLRLLGARRGRRHRCARGERQGHRGLPHLCEEGAALEWRLHDGPFGLRAALRRGWPARGADRLPGRPRARHRQTPRASRLTPGRPGRRGSVRGRTPRTGRRGVDVMHGHRAVHRPPQGPCILQTGFHVHDRSFSKPAADLRALPRRLALALLRRADRPALRDPARRHRRHLSLQGRVQGRGLCRTPLRRAGGD